MSVNFKFKPGEEVYFKDNFDNIHNGRIRSADWYEDTKNKTIIPYYIIYDKGHYSIREENVFNSREEAIKTIAERNRKRTEDFTSQINTIEDLVVFMYNHNVCPAEEYTDWEAREAAKIKAEEFGIELERK